MNYDLRTGDDGSFYRSLSEYTDIVLKEGNKRFDGLFNKMSLQSGMVSRKNRHAIILNLLIAGLLWREYKNRNWFLGFLFLPWFLALDYIQSTFPKIKLFSGTFKGVVGGFILNTHIRYQYNFSIRNYKLMLAWLKATGEYNEEYRKLKEELAFWESLSPIEFKQMFGDVVDFSEWFYKGGRFYLGDYTVHVNEFVRQNEKRYRFKENYFFCVRTEAIYFLNMVGGEILNRLLVSEFSKTKRQIILLPTCMRHGSECNAIQKGETMFCAECKKDCNIGNVSRMTQNHAVEVAIIPQTTSFTQFIEPFANQSEVGLIRVACVLNLLRGGFEMMNLKIASQCVFLDFPGCSKHWCSKSIPTMLTNVQLYHLISKKTSFQSEKILE